MAVTQVNGVTINKLTLSKYRELKESNQLVNNECYTITDIDDYTYKYIESGDSSKPIILRNLESGIYKIYGYFKYYSSYSSYSAVDPFAILIVEKGSSFSYVTIIASNDIIKYKITDSNYEKVDDTGWINLSLNSGISAYNSSSFPVRYRKIGNKVRIEGAVKGITAKSTIIATLPSGFIPANNHYYINAGPSGRVNTYEIRTNGAIVFINTTSTATLVATDYYFIEYEYFID